MKSLITVIALGVNIFSSGIVSGQTLTIKVSDTLLVLNQKWAEAYKTKHPAADIQVSGEGTSVVFATLAEKKADLVLVSRSMRYKEAQACEAALGRRPVEHKVAVSGLAVYVNTNNPVKVIKYDELNDIFRGRSKNWKDLDGGNDQAISVYAQVTNSIHGELFNEEVLDGQGFSAEVHLLAGQDVLKAAESREDGASLLRQARF